MPVFSPRQLALLRETVLENEFIPDYVKVGLERNKKQIDLLITEAREILFGGSAGGGKSYGALMYASQYLGVPKYSALVLRRTFAQMGKAESIYSVAVDWWAGMKNVHHNGSEHKFRFPSGATVEFGHMNTEAAKYNYQGGGYHRVIFDELTQFPESPYRYLFGRQRKPEGSLIPLGTLATANPGGVGHQWVKNRFIDPKTRKPEAVFIPSRLSDNGNLDQASYIQGLNELDPVTRRQMLDGDWDAIEGGRFKSEWLRYYELHGEFIKFDDGNAHTQWFRWRDRTVFFTVDTAASAKTSADFTVIAVWCLSARGHLILLALVRFQAEVPDVMARIKSEVRRWKPAFVAIEEVGAHSGKAIGQLLRRSIDPAMTIKSMSPKGQDKLARAAAAITLAHDGRIWLPPQNSALWPKDEVEAELLTFTGAVGEDGNDDVVDVFSYAAELLPSLSSTSIIGGPTGSVGGLPALRPQGTLQSAPGTSKAKSPTAPSKPAMGVGKAPGW